MGWASHDDSGEKFYVPDGNGNAVSFNIGLKLKAVLGDNDEVNDVEEVYREAVASVASQALTIIIQCFPTT